MLKSGAIGMSLTKTLGAITAALLISTVLALTPLATEIEAADGRCASLPSSVSASTNRTVNITGEVIGTDGWRIVNEFLAVAINNETGEESPPEYVVMGLFTIAIQVPTFAIDNATIDIRILSPDLATLYANATLKLNNTNHTSSYFLKLTVANPPPNYNGLLLIVLVLVFALILAGYILFTKWLVAQAVLRRANEIMIEKERLQYGNAIEEGDDDEDDAEEDQGSDPHKED